MNIAVVGAGIAGLSVSFLLKEQGHEVTIFEQAPKCMPVGAGILLQPSGQKVLKKLNLLTAIESTSRKLEGILANRSTGQTLVSLNYNQLSPELYGLGVRRSLLFSLLHDRCQKAGVEIIEDARITSARQSSDKVSIALKGKEFNFDIAISADGSRSMMRTIFSPVTKVHTYDYAAVWTLAPAKDLPPRLWQLVSGTKHLLGVLPVEDSLCSFFWGIPSNQKDIFFQSNIDHWKNEVRNLTPKLDQILDTITDLNQFTFADYRHSKMSSYHNGRVVFIGDAAHASSPHLGQGVNLALEDALALSDSINSKDTYKEAFTDYQSKRQASTRYYSMITALLTPFFQSDYPILGLGRDIALPLMPQIPWIKTQMISSMAGLKKSFFN